MTLLSRPLLFFCGFLWLGIALAEHGESIIESTQGPEVFEQPYYDVDVIKDVPYAQGLSHSDWNSEEASVMDLLLDVYQPKNVATKLPVIFIFHGGGFENGKKEREEIVAAAQFFASRGFLALAPTYRVAPHYGTLPSNLFEALESWPSFLKKDRDAFFAMYPACRDAKAAVRWLYANADTYNADTRFITSYGNSAGALMSVVLGTTEEEAYTREISIEDDPTLATTHLEQPARIHTIINHWGGPLALDMQRYFFDHYPYDHQDAPMQIVHGTIDTRVPFIEALRLALNFEMNDIHYELNPLHWVGHNATYEKLDGKTHDELALDFIVRMQKLDLNVVSEKGL